MTKLNDGSFQCALTNYPGTQFTVWATTNLLLPFSNWTVLGGVTEVLPGQFQINDPGAAQNLQRFYRVSSP